MATIQDVITQVQSYMATLPDVRKAPSEPTDSLAVYPFIVTHPGRGRIVIGDPAGSKTAFHTIYIDVHVARKDLPRDYLQAVPFVESIPNILGLNRNNNKWNNLISTFGDITYEMMEFNYSPNPTIGFRFVVPDIKILGALA